jgi:hypothetical protein
LHLGFLIGDPDNLSVAVTADSIPNLKSMDDPLGLSFYDVCIIIRVLLHLAFLIGKSDNLSVF